MKPDISEFSYGYAVTEELVAKHKAIVVGAPTFPSLYEEGKKGGGYDVQIPIKGTPIFLQFKLSDRLERTSAKEHQLGLVSVPYYRMHLRPLKHSDQHELLLDLEATGEAVFYIAPEFHLPAELNNFYLSKAVIKNSAAFKPSSIGKLPSNGEHYVVFQKSASHGFRCSDHPKQVSRTSLSDGLRAAIREKRPRNIGRDEIIALSNKMLEVLEKRSSADAHREAVAEAAIARRIVSERDPLEVIGFIALNFFGCELVIVE
jgi:hypothetical protein